MDGIYNSSTRGKMAASFKTKGLMKRLRDAAFEHKQTDSVATATALSEARADIVDYIGKLEAAAGAFEPKKRELPCGGRARCFVCAAKYIEKRKREYAVTPWSYRGNQTLTTFYPSRTRLAPRPGHPIWYGVDEAAAIDETVFRQTPAWQDLERYTKNYSRPAFVRSYVMKPLAPRMTPASVWGIA